jgi:hypothetical protein
MEAESGPVRRAGHGGVLEAAADLVCGAEKLLARGEGFALL